MFYTKSNINIEMFHDNTRDAAKMIGKITNIVAAFARKSGDPKIKISIAVNEAYRASAFD
jgi:phenylpyruvate tautomerase PptA (4-oxalocrotonate tautomerase family)